MHREVLGQAGNDLPGAISRTVTKHREPPRPSRARLFAALGDETRLAVIGQLSLGNPLSITRLTAGSDLTRQAVTKHLRILASAGLVQSRRLGRESLYELNLAPLREVKTYVEEVSALWDTTLARLKAFAER